MFFAHTQKNHKKLTVRRGVNPYDQPDRQETFFLRHPLIQVSRRYTDFALLQSALQDSGIPLNLPKKKMVGNLGTSKLHQAKNKALP